MKRVFLQDIPTRFGCLMSGLLTTEFLQVLQAPKPAPVVALGLNLPIPHLTLEPLDLGLERGDFLIQFTDPTHHADFEVAHLRTPILMTRSW